MEIRSVVERSAETLKKAGSGLLKGYQSTVDKVTGAEIARNMEAVQQEMETVYAAVVTRIVALENELEAERTRSQRLAVLSTVALLLAIVAMLIAWSRH